MRRALIVAFSNFIQRKWPYNKDYDGWWGHDTLPKLNYEESESLCELYSENRTEVGVTALQCGWLAFGCGGGSRSFSRSIIIYSGNVSEKQSKKQILMP